MSYRKECCYCKQEILLDKDESERWRAFEITGDLHLCQNKIGPKTIVKQCTFCGEAIELVNTSAGYKPYNEDRTLHRCLKGEQKK